MTEQPVSSRQTNAIKALRRVLRFAYESSYSKRMGDPDICDLTFGNPHDVPVPAFVDALRKWTPPQHKNWFAYTQNHEPARTAIAASLRTSHGLSFGPADIFMTPGAAGAIAAAMGTFLDPGDEVIYSLPPWFCYEAAVVHVGGVPVKVPTRAENFDLDIDAIASAMTPRTRMVIVNTPCNPTGRIYKPAVLEQLADVLQRASERAGRAIYILSDEPYNRLIFDGAKLHSPASFYARTVISYSYAKTLLNPGARLGYLAVHPDMPHGDVVRATIDGFQVAAGWQYPNSVLQYAVEDLEAIEVDIPRLQAKRDYMLRELRAIGYDVHTPEATFYLLPRSPLPDDLAFTELLAEGDVFVMPGDVCEIPGYIRISLTATEKMLETSIPVFADAFARAQRMRADTSERAP